MLESLANALMPPDLGENGPDLICLMINTQLFFLTHDNWYVEILSIIGEYHCLGLYLGRDQIDRWNNEMPITIG